MRVTPNKQEFVAKLERRGYKRVGVEQPISEELGSEYEVYARPKSGRQYWVFDEGAQCVVIEEFRITLVKHYTFCAESDLINLESPALNPKTSYNTPEPTSQAHLGFAEGNPKCPDGWSTETAERYVIDSQTLKNTPEHAK